MKKLGFTLAEVLITLAIIGVVAAITIPALMHSMDKTHYTSAIKTFQSNFTNGFAEMMATEMVDSLRDASPWNCFGNDMVLFSNTDDHKCIYKAMKNYFSLSDPIDGVPEGVVIHDIAGNTMNNAFEETIRYTLPNNMTININYMSPHTDKTKAECEAIKDKGGSMCGIAAHIFLDVNGNKKPNIVGKDIYRFALGPNGKLYPAGGKDESIYNGGTNSKWKTTCNGKPLPDACKGYDSYNLTGRVVEEGNRITYY